MINNYKSYTGFINKNDRFLRDSICPEKGLMEDRVMHNDGCRFYDFSVFRHLPQVPASFQKDQIFSLRQNDYG